MVIIHNNKTYIRVKDKFWLIIDDFMEKINIIGMAHRIRHEGIQKKKKKT